MATKTIRNSIAVLTVPVMALIGLAPMANAAQPAKTRVLIQAESRSFSGYVKSGRLACKDGRKVVLFEQLGSSPKPRNDDRVGTDIAQANNDGYQWSMGNLGLEPGGRYYARAPRTSECKPANSVTLTSQE